MTVLARPIVISPRLCVARFFPAPESSKLSRFKRNGKIGAWSRALFDSGLIAVWRLKATNIRWATLQSVRLACQRVSKRVLAPLGARPVP